MIKKIVTHNIFYYLSLFLILAIGLFLALYTSYDKALQMAMIVITGFSYVVWGIIHHLIQHDLHPKIVIEYILIGSLGMTIVLYLLKGGIL